MTGQQQFDAIVSELRDHKAKEESLSARHAEIEETLAAERARLAEIEATSLDALADLSGDLASVRASIQAATQRLHDCKLTQAEEPSPAPAEDLEAIEADGVQTAEQAMAIGSARLDLPRQDVPEYHVNPFHGVTDRFPV